MWVPGVPWDWSAGGLREHPRVPHTVPCAVGLAGPAELPTAAPAGPAPRGCDLRPPRRGLAPPTPHLQVQPLAFVPGATQVPLCHPNAHLAEA